MSRTVLITGASSGIGREVALALADRGDSLVLVARRVAELEEVAAVCRRSGAPEVVVAPADVADQQEWEGAIDQALLRFRAIDVVVHAAAVAAYGEFVDIPGEVFERVQRVNVVGTANVARSALHHFKTQRAGHLVVFGSLVGTIGTPYLSPYVTSKWAVHGLTRTLQAEHQGDPIDISLIEPGGVSTTIYDKAASYLGVQGKPPPPVYDAKRVALATVRTIDRPRRERNVGFLNPLVTAGFRFLPSVYDRIVAPLMTRLALGTDPVDDHTGNLFATSPEVVPPRR